MNGQADCIGPDDSAGGARARVIRAAGAPTGAALYPALQIAADHRRPVRQEILPAAARNNPDARQG